MIIIVCMIGEGAHLPYPCEVARQLFGICSFLPPLSGDQTEVVKLVDLTENTFLC